jgi:hypothetical protein
VAQQLPATVIKIEPANPQVVYVPQYNPRSCTGPGRTRPAVLPCPPGYAWQPRRSSARVAVGAVWGNCNWRVQRGRRRQQDRQTSTNVNRTTSPINAASACRRASAAIARNEAQPRIAAASSTATRRRSSATTAASSQAQSREAYRGRAEQDARDIGGRRRPFRRRRSGGGRAESAQAQDRRGVTRRVSGMWWRASGARSDRAGQSSRQSMGAWERGRAAGRWGGGGGGGGRGGGAGRGGGRSPVMRTLPRIDHASVANEVAGGQQGASTASSS